MPGVKKEDLAALPALQDIGPKDLLRDDAVYFLGLMAAQALRTHGQVTLIMGGGDDGKVCIANPVHVYLDAQAMMNEDLVQLPPFRYVRPVLGSGRPQYCAWKEGELWEIEFVDDEPQEDTISSDHP